MPFYGHWLTYTARFLNSSHGYYFLEINDYKNELKLGNQIIISLSNKLYPAKLSIQNHKKGAYVLISKDLLEDFDLKKYFKVQINYLNDMFHSKVTQHNLVIPKRLVSKEHFKRDDIVYLSAYSLTGDTIYFKNLISKVVKNSKENKFILNVPTKYGIEEAVFKLNPAQIPQLSSPLDDILNGLNLAKFGNDKIVFFYGKNKKPAFIYENGVLNNEIIYYLGAYFADGAKKGYKWLINASSPEQAKFYFKMHHSLIYNPNIDCYVRLTVKNYITDKEVLGYWHDNSDLVVSKVSRLPSKSDRIPPNYLKYGSLVMREHNASIHTFYIKLINYIIDNEIIKKNSKRNALDFILGFLEGDGFVAPKSSSGEIGLAVSKSEVGIMEKILKVTGLNYWVSNKNTNGPSIFVYSRDILTNLPYIYMDLFKFYPKRRYKFIERLTDSPMSEFILGKRTKIANWIKGYLKNKNLILDNGNLTTSGEHIREILLHLIKENSKYNNDLRPSPEPIFS
ncbi:MAG: hypothetical protein M1573_02335 [Candidatus Parvarchaeota archaeon]|jgi:hypothetical protein|nr:hypothetical protein [Candidatus Parvarchaeota archaeon]MCL5018052.1 hypothetical protein [Candidatus Parvarchaeota archaeon]